MLTVSHMRLANVHSSMLKCQYTSKIHESTRSRGLESNAQEIPLTRSCNEHKKLARL